MMVLAGVALLAVALNVQAVGPNKAADETQSGAVNRAQDTQYKVKPIVPLWQKVEPSKTGKQLASAKRPDCGSQLTKEDCDALWYCTWTVDRCHL
ncbi:hypothetical protein [Solilutibacter silvestris]|uniref:hypothetical protein n=1 Tax=Solilutibacter silvestris TaxID=1645665 RepID=UPI003D326BF1